MVGSDAVGSAAERVAGQRVTTWLLRNVEEMPTAVALRARSTGSAGSGAAGSGAAGSAGAGWTELTWAEVGDRAARLATALRRLGVSAGDRVLLFLRNRPEFQLADLAALLCRATPVSCYLSAPPEQLRYLAEHSSSRVAFVDDVELLGRLLEVRDRLPELRAVVVVDDPAGLAPPDVLRFADLLGEPPVDLAAAAAAARPDDLVTVTYTSGTTGSPKGVMIDHSNVAWQCAAYLDLIGPVEPGWRVVSYLPMAHIAERMVSHYHWLCLRLAVTCCPDPGQLGSYLVAVRPHGLFGPPRVWEKLRAGIQAALAAGGPDRLAGFSDALRIGRQVAELRARDEPLPPALAAAFERVDAAAFAPLRARVGLDEIRSACSGAAPLPTEVFGFFRAIGLPFSEIYGLSENTGGMAWDPWRVRAGTVGRAYPGAEVKLLADGEIVCRGGIVSRGYLDDPDRTADTFDPDGWLHTGDIGRIDADGYLTIVDRKKELIITSGGKNISPVNIESQLTSLPLVGQACVIGDRRPYLVALLVLDPEVAPVWAAGHGLSDTDLPALAGDPLVRAELDRGVADINRRLSPPEQVKRFAVLGAEWLPDSPQLTPTMKLKRRGVLASHREEIERLYAGSPAVPAGPPAEPVAGPPPAPPPGPVAARPAGPAPVGAPTGAHLGG